MNDIRDLFADYAAYHTAIGNKWCHRLGIPLIVFSLLGLLSLAAFEIGGRRIDAAMIVIALTAIYYLRLEWRLGLAMILFSLLSYLVARQLPVAVNAGLFVGGWVLQFVGHGVYEKKSPAFLKNLTHLLVGPLWVLNDLLPVIRSSRPDSPA